MDVIDVFVCKRMPELGSYGWVEWLQENGECVLIGKDETKSKSKVN